MATKRTKSNRSEVAADAVRIPAALPREAVGEGRFVLERQLGPGGAAFVARDRAGGEVVIKLAPRPDDPDLADLIQQEFLIASELRHPHLERVITAGREPDGTPWFAAEYLSGESLAGASPLPPEELLELTAQLCLGLHHLHTRGLIHGDVTPGNIVRIPLTGGRAGAAHRATLVDLGFARPETQEIEDGTLRGSWGFLPPEVLCGGAATRAADLYALGVTLHVLATGDLPFAGDTPHAMLAAQRAGLPVDFSIHHPQVPLALEAIIRRLLEPALGRRYDDANAVIRELNAFAGTDFEEENAPAEMASRLARPPLLGRDADLLELLRVVQPLRTGAAGPRTSTVVVRGAPGVGRSRLIEEVQARIDLSGVTTITARALPEDPRPLGAAGDLLHGAVARIAPDDSFRTQHAAILAREALGSALPGDPGADVAPTELEAERLAAALLALAGDRPLVLLLDDLQSLSQPQRAWVTHLHRAVQVAQEHGTQDHGRILLVTTWRAGPASQRQLDLVLAEFGAGVATHELAPLRAEAGAELARWALGGTAVPEALRLPLGNDAPRTPRDLLARARSLFERQAIARDARGEIVTTPALAEWHPPRDAGDLAAREVEGLGRTARQLLTALAVFVRPVPPGVPLHLVQAGRATALQALADLQSRGIVRRTTVDGRSRLTLSHAGDRRALLRGYAKDARERLAKRALRALESSPEARSPEFLEERARLTAESGTPSAALRRALEAATWAQSSGQPRVGAESLRRALELSKRPSRLRHDAELALFELELTLGEFEAARQRLDRFAAGADSAMRLRLARVLTAQGRFQDARALCEAALDGADDAPPVIAAALHERLAFCALSLGDHAVAQRHVKLGAPLAEGPSASHAQVRCALNLVRAGLCWSAGRLDEAITLLRESRADARARGDAEQELLALGNIGMVLRSLDQHDDALRTSEAASALCDDAGLVLHRPRVLNALGLALAFTGQLAAAESTFVELLGLSRRLTHQLGELQATANLSNMLDWQGRAAESFAHAEVAESLASRAGNGRLAAVVALGLVARTARLQHIPQAHGWLRRAAHHLNLDPQDPAHAGLGIGRGQIAEATADWRGARGHYQAAEQAARAVADQPSASRAAAFGVLAALRAGEPAESLTAPEPAPASADWRVTVPVAVARAALALHRGEVDSAEALLTTAQTLLPTEAADPVALAVPYWRGRLAEQREQWVEAHAAHQVAWDGWTSLARNAPGQAESSVLAAPVPEDLRLRLERARRELRQADEPTAAGDLSADDLARVAATARALARERRVVPLLHSILDATIRLTGAERGFVILAGEADADLLAFPAARNMDGDKLSRPEQKISRSIARQAMREEHVLVTSDAQRDPRFQSFVSVHKLQLRSILCAPLCVDGVPEGCVYVDHRFTVDAFDARARALTEAFAAHAGLALQTARLMDERETALRDADALRANLEEALAVRTAQLHLVTDRTVAPSDDLQWFEGIVGNSTPMREVFRLIDKFADAEMPVLVLGESGTGKELVAQAIHRRSRRADGPILSENLGALNPTVAASELFGHVVGAFTGAVRPRRGLFELAKGGTLFLDEIGDLDPDIQVALLRVLEDGRVRPVGGETPVTVDTRVICATNRDLRRDIAAGTFREDLFYRLNVLTIELPPLRDRREDVAALTQFFRATIARERGRCPQLSPETTRLFTEHSWPGNVRELENELRRAAVVAGDGPIRPSHCSAELTGTRSASAAPGPMLEEAQSRGFWDVIAETEARLIREALAAAGGNQSEAARRLQLDRVVLIRKMREYGLRDSVTAPRRGRPRRRR